MNSTSFADATDSAGLSKACKLGIPPSTASLSEATLISPSAEAQQSHNGQPRTRTPRPSHFPLHRPVRRLDKSNVTAMVIRYVGPGLSKVVGGTRFGSLMKTISGTGGCRLLHSSTSLNPSRTSFGLLREDDFVPLYLYEIPPSNGKELFNIGVDA